MPRLKYYDEINKNNTFIKPRCIAKNFQGYRCGREGVFNKFCFMHVDYISKLKKKIKIMEEEIKRVT